MYGYKTFHEELMNNLIENARNGNASHAYIFEGAKGLFKHESARLFAAALTCLSQKNAPCGVCSSCNEAIANSNPDIIYVEKPKDKTRITVDTIRKINEDAVIKPFNSPKKVYIINDGDLLTDEAQNAFLKTFEEPPEYAVFIIIVESSAKLLQTILSRAVTVSFTQVPNKVIETMLLENYPQERERIPFIVNFSEGIPGKAEEIINNPHFEEMRSEAIDMLKYLLSPNKNDAFKTEEFIDKNKDEAETLFDFWISYLRDIIVLQCSAFDMAINTDKLSALKKYSEMYDERKIASAIDALIEGKKMMDRYVKAGASALHCALKIRC